MIETIDTYFIDRNIGMRRLQSQTGKLKQNLSSQKISQIGAMKRGPKRNGVPRMAGSTRFRVWETPFLSFRFACEGKQKDIAICKQIRSSSSEPNQIIDPKVSDPFCRYAICSITFHVNTPSQLHGTSILSARITNPIFLEEN